MQPDVIKSKSTWHVKIFHWILRNKMFHLFFLSFSLTEFLVIFFGSPQFQRMEVQDQSAGQVAFLQGHLPWLVDSHLLPVSAHGHLNLFFL